MIGSLTDIQREMADVEKRRKHRQAQPAERVGHAPAAEAPGLTAAHAVAEAETTAGGDATAGRAAGAGKASCENLDATPGPGRFGEPGTIEPSDFRRRYLEAGHAAVSPQHGPPTADPLPPEGRGILRPLRFPSAPEVAGTGPGVAAIAQHVARAQSTAGVIPDPGGAA
jgi:hypothetical protein